MNNQIDQQHLDRFAAALDMEEFRQIAEGKSDMTGRSGMAIGRIIAYSHRRDGIVDFAIERHLRAHPGARAVYNRALQQQAIASSDLAIAASGEKVLKRSVGGHRLECIEDDGELFLVVHLARSLAVPAMIEVRGSEGNGVRCLLGKPVRGIIQMQLDRRDPQMSLLADLLIRPDSAIHLLD